MRDDTISVAAAAELLDVSRRTIYRWQDEQRLPYVLKRDELLARRDELQPRARGPQRKATSKRYTVGRHTFVANERTLLRSHRMIRCPSCHALVRDLYFCTLCGEPIKDP